ncbi:MAG: hypothetical protein GXP50_00595 [Deltaproteobacteria bacterium]|nr:hypothetical protein [Deltaproteobacteria bacterium]
MADREKKVLVEVADGIATLTIDRPKALNALNGAVVADLEAAFDEAVARPDVKALVIQGAGDKAFVAGADIKFFIDNIEADRVADIVAFARRGQKVLRKIEKSPKPVIAKVDGLALGGGLELALACTAIVVTDKAGVGLPETGIGIFPGLGGTQRTARVVGKELGKYLVFTGQILDGKTAHEIGLAGYLAADDVDGFIRDLVARGEFRDKYAPKPTPAGWEPVVEAFSDAHVQEVLAGTAPNDDPRVAAAVKAVGRKAPLALKVANRIIDEGLQKSLDDALELELANLGEIFSTQDALVGLKSVVERYRPEFKGE